MKFFKKRKIITREDGKPYLIRWNVFECKYFSIKLHKILLSDHDCLHDHPWTFISFILWGGYVEHSEKWSYTNDNCHIEKVSKIYHPGNILFRKAKWKHKLEIHQPCYTIVLTLKKIRQWGFWTKKGWIPWFKYTPTKSCE